MLETDPIQLRILFQNLLSNIFRFSKVEPSRPVKIFAEKKGDDRWRIVFRGNGEGFEMEKFKKILSPDFNEDDRFEIDKEEMGLSLCKRIVRRLGGSMYEENNHNGFSFNIVLPEIVMRHSYRRDTAW